jgi:hypothetical protein
VYKGPRYYSCIQVLASLVLGMPEILLQGLISVNFLRRAARYVQNNYHNTSSVTSMIDTLGWPTLAEHRLKTRLITIVFEI